MPELVLGPILRYVGEREATLWVETDSACEVRVLDAAERTFCVGGHHYALVLVEGLEPGSSHEYEVLLDGERRWPAADSGMPPSRIRTLEPGADVRVSFGSCRVALPHEPPYTLGRDQHPQGAEVDALRVLARELADGSHESYPTLLLLLGDQVYVDEGSPEVRDFIRSRRDTSMPPGEEVLDFEEYTRLYRESWREPYVRWLFSTLPVAMVIDDHDMSDDWNISREWVRDMEREAWWWKRVEAGFMTYWLYQHLGNLSPAELAHDETFAAVRRSRDDATAILRDYGLRAHHDREGIRWSFKRDLGSTRLVVMDNRGGRVLEPGRRAIFDDEEREWVFAQARGEFDHLLLAASDPILLTPTFHHLEAWNEALCDGAWGSVVARGSERLRRALDFDHWAAFGASFRRIWELVREVGAGARGRPPASIVLLSGDVHHAYLAEVAFPRSAGVRSAVYQAVCSPFRNPLGRNERRGIRLSLNPAVEAIAHGLARAAGVADPEVRWRFAEGPHFDNQVATLEIAGRTARLRLEKTRPGETDEATLETTFSRRLA